MWSAAPQRPGSTLVGGATGLIGDPKESGERTLNPVDVVATWVERIRSQLERFFEFDGVPNAAVMVNNYDWTQSLSTLEFLRDVGKHFSVNRMLDREAVAARLAGAGISYTEFSYQLLQSYDYLQLFQRYGCSLQTGGSDQWGNIVAGVDLIRRVRKSTTVGRLADTVKPDVQAIKLSDARPCYFKPNVLTRQS